MKRTRRNRGATFKGQAALAAVKGDKTLTELAEQLSVQLTDWKQQLLALAADVFVGTKTPSETPDLTSALCPDVPLDFSALPQRLSDQSYTRSPSAARRSDRFALLAADVNADGISEVVQP